MDKRYIEVVFSPPLFEYRKIREHYIVIVVDVLRATTSICTAFEYGVNSMIPVKTLEEAFEYKQKGFIVAGERIEHTFDFADLGNGAFEFMSDKIKYKDIVHSTTNGTVAISMAKEANADEILIGAFSNISLLEQYLLEKKENVLIFCSGWKNTFCIEDTLFAGALIERLNKGEEFTIYDDAANCALDLWSSAKTDVLGYVEKASHLHRLRKHGMGDVLEYTFKEDTCSVLPRLMGNKLVDIIKEDKNKK